METALDEHMPGWRIGEPAIAYESGRYLSAACGVLVSSVVDIKESKGSRFIVLDSGIHHLGGMAGLGRIPRVQYDIKPITEKPDTHPESAHIVGPLCTPLDFLTKKQLCLPYNWKSSSTFRMLGLMGLRPVYWDF